MAYRLRGMGAAGAYDTLDLTNWSNLSSWWCASTGLCSKDMVAASQAYQNPGTAYPPLPVLAKGGAVPTAEQLATVPPASLPGDLVGQQTEENQAAMQRYFEDVAGSGDTPLNEAGGTNWMVWALVALAGVIGIAALGGGSPRRYGR